MEKQRMINEIAAKLASMSIPSQIGIWTDVAVQAEFLDASWKTGSKKISYQSAAFLNEAERTLYYWELTTESGSGFSFGSSSESTFQSGTTLYRKVKGVGYGPDGKAYEYSLDLGAITKTFKEAAKQQGWKFKTVLKKEKASYPPGYEAFPEAPVLPVQSSQAQPPQDQGFQGPEPLQNLDTHSPTSQSQAYGPSPQQPFDNPQAPFYAQGKSLPPKGRISVFGWISSGLLALITTLFFYFGKASLVGWCLAGLVLIINFFLQKKFSHKGYIVGLALWVLAFIVLFFVFGFSVQTPTDKQSVHTSQNTTQSLSSFSEIQKNSVSQARVEDVGFARSVDAKTMKPVELVGDVFRTDDPVLYYVMKMFNTPKGTNLHFLWSYNNGQSTLDFNQVLSDNIEGNYYAVSIKASNNVGFPAGKFSLLVDAAKDGKTLFKFKKDFTVAAGN